MAEQHPWALLPVLVQAEILTADEAKNVVLGTTSYNRIMGELQAAVAEAHAKGEEVITTKKLYSIVSKIQMQESPSF